MRILAHRVARTSQIDMPKVQFVEPDAGAIAGEVTPEAAGAANRES